MGPKIIDCSSVDCEFGIKVDGAAVEVDGFTAIDTPVALRATRGGRINARRVVHHPDSSKAPEEVRRKYFGGHSFAKGDHLKK